MEDQHRDELCATWDHHLLLAMIFISEDDGDQYQFEDTTDALNFIEKLITENEGKEVTITVYVRPGSIFIPPCREDALNPGVY